MAAADVSQLPPIEVYQIGEAYFVLDGNHRVSIARRQGLENIDAEVIEVRTKVPLSPDDQPDELIIKAEYAAFLDSTGLDHLRPDADLRVSIPGQYTKVENYIEVHRYFTEVEEDRELTDNDAVSRWYDEAYAPMIEAIREQGILRYFPGRTETDFYVWLARHRADLQRELDWDIGPETAVAKLASRYEHRPDRPIFRLSHRILDVVVPDRWKSGSGVETWSQSKILVRYSDRLFADILVPLSDDENSWKALDQALVVAGYERAQLHGLCLLETEMEENSKKVRDVQTAFKQRCQDAGLDGHLTMRTADPADEICKRAVLADLVVMDPFLPKTAGEENRFRPEFERLTQRLSRPLLVVPKAAASLERILLAYDGRAKAKEALFVAAYLGEQWQANLVIVTVQESRRNGQNALDFAREYLSIHEVDATYLLEHEPVAEALLHTAAAHECDLIVVGEHDPGLARKTRLGRTVEHLLRQWDRSLLICP
jgi:nucleotide-binding universal stress UspA family protein